MVDITIMVDIHTAAMAVTEATILVAAVSEIIKYYYYIIHIEIIKF